MSGKRAGLRGREQFAIAADVEAQRKARQQIPEPQPQRSTPARKQAPAQPPAGAGVRCGIALSPEAWALARGAFLADWAAGGTADVFPRWVEHAMLAHARRTPEQRAELAGPAPKGAAVRTVLLDQEVVDAMHQAIEDDTATGRVRSDRRWIGEALEAAIESTRRRDGTVAAADALPRTKLRRTR